MTPVALPDFATWFEALWGHPPFAWQSRFVSDAADGRYPGWVTLPTGLGKTSTLDAAVYLLASQAHLPASERTAPVRIVFAVNRRIVVDEAFRRARRIASRLALSCGQLREEDVEEEDRLPRERLNLLQPVASALRSLAGEEAPPLETYPLRGATFTDSAWARSPLQPLVISTTLDQLGSRLLFRGYGCSEGARPTHAALLAYDSLLILDEAHTAAAFSETLEAVASWRRESGSDSLPLPFQSIQLTATPPAGVSNPFRLLEEEKDQPVVRDRLASTKPTSLSEVVGAKGKQRHNKLSDQVGGLVEAFFSDHHQVRRILVAVNRVDTARTIRESLKIKDTAVEILVGGMRPLDREQLVEKLVSTYQLQSSRPAPDVPRLVLVATQCVEVGADLDFDALITELAPLDALRQRFGRLNRYGRDMVSPAAIVAPEESLATGANNPDPIYGTCLPVVWAWLKRHEHELDFGTTASDRILPAGDAIGTLLAPHSSAPILLPTHLDLLCQTSPAPHVEPDPALYIHGPARDFPTVEVIVRRNLSDAAVATLEVLPPLSTEAATVSLSYLRHWLADETNKGDTDAPTLFEDRLTNTKAALPDAWIVRPGYIEKLTSISLLRKGDRLVLSDQCGRIEQLILGYAETAADQCEAAYLMARDKSLLVLNRSQIDRWIGHGDSSLREAVFALLAPIQQAESERTEEGEEAPFCLPEWKAALPELIKLFAANCESCVWDGARRVSPEDWRIDPHPEGGIIARSKERVGLSPWPHTPPEIGAQGDFGECVPLSDHQKQVESIVSDTAKRLGLPTSMHEALVLAARYHDLGKADPRFQAWLHGCGYWNVVGKPLVAKSNYPSNKRRDYARSANIPEAFRHELLSALMVADSALAAHPEADLLLHLIASHHGRCRGAAPVVLDADPENFDVTIEEEIIAYRGRSAPLAHFGEGVPRRFWKLTRRFGWWGLAYLETLLRLADQRASASDNPPPS